jgi:hypothetical protein
VFLFLSGRPRDPICHQAAGRPTHNVSRKAAPVQRASPTTRGRPTKHCFSQAGGPGTRFVVRRRAAPLAFCRGKWPLAPEKGRASTHGGRPGPGTQIPGPTPGPREDISREAAGRPSRLRADQAPRVRAGGSSPRLRREAPDPQFVSSRWQRLTVLFLKSKPAQGSKGLSDDARKGYEALFFFSGMPRPRDPICL